MGLSGAVTARAGAGFVERGDALKPLARLSVFERFRDSSTGTTIDYQRDFVDTLYSFFVAQQICLVLGSDVLPS